jgi:hypothetical protein
LFALSAVYVYAAHRLMADTLPRPKLDPSAQLRFVITGLSVFAHSLFGITLLPGAVAHPWVPLACAACAAFTIFRAPRTAVAWLLGLSILVLNIALVAVSNRVGIWGDIMAYEARYYYDVDFLVLVFLGIIAHELESDAHAPRRPPLDYGRPIPAAVLAVALFAHAVFSARNVFTGAFAVSRALPETRAFVANLKADLSSVRARGVDAKFVDGNLPVFVSGLDLNFRKHSQLFRVLGLPGEFVPEPLAVLRVADDCHLVETKAR